MTSLSILRDPSRTSLKRLAWSYAHAPRGSDEEQAILDILLARIAREIHIQSHALMGTMLDEVD